MMKRILNTVALILVGIYCQAQTKPIRTYSLPKGATQSDYRAGILLAKLKPAYQSMAVASSTGRSTTLPGVNIRPLANPELVRQNRTARGPVSDNQFKIDISLYVRLTVDAGTNLETKINELYSTGYFDVVEPEFVDRFSFSPNDPLGSQQYYVGLIKAYEAWDISQSDAGTVIAIVDSGGDMKHSDLAANLYTNPDEIANNNVDDDHDGYIDNVHGWDFMGADTLNLYNSSFLGDNDPDLKQPSSAGVLSHGVWVAGCAAAVGNNNNGITGIGFKSKLLWTKHSADNQKAGSVYLGYLGILYAAQTLHQDNIGRIIINCSWGGSYRSQIAQDIITHVTLDLGALVVAAAGNDGTKNPSYPADYDYALSVGATDKDDIKASFSNFGPLVDLSAPGVGIITTAYENAYNTVSGTSFSSPITAGAAAVVWSKFPSFTPVQVAEQLRVTADNVDALSLPVFTQQMGRGRLNVKNALTQTSPSVRLSKPIMLDNQGNTADLGKEALLTLSFTNFLQTSGALKVNAASSSGFVTFTKSEINLDPITSGTTVRNTLNPFKVVISASTPQNTVVEIKFTYTDGSYTDWQVIQVLLNPSFFNLDQNKITTSICSTGRIGYDDPDQETIGVGFVVSDTPILFEMGLITGTSATNLYNNVRGVGTTFDQDFVQVTPIKRIIPGVRTAEEIFGSFSPSSAPSLLISYRGMTMKDKPNEKFVVVEYTLTNNSTAAITNFRFGMFADWDISNQGSADAADWDAPHKIGYVFPKGSTTLPHAGIQALNAAASVYSIDNDQKIAGNPFGLYDGFTKDEKYTTISSTRNQAGNTTSTGNDVSHVVSVSPFTIPAGGSVILAFALHAANNLADLLASADAASRLYNQTFTAPQPTVTVSDVCFGKSATVTATGPGTKFRWYRTLADGHPFDSLSTSIVTANLFKDSTIYVSNADQPYESVRTAAVIKLKANPAIISAGTAFCPGQSIALSVASADSYTWSNGATTQSISVNAVGNYSVTVKYNALNCTSTSPVVAVTTLAKPVAGFTASGDLIAGGTIFFTDASTNPLSWAWDFGDGGTATTKSPAHTYVTPNSYSVKLSIVGSNGCQDAITQKIAVITGLDEITSITWLVFPSPAADYIQIRLPVTVDHAQVALFNIQGQQVLDTTLSSEVSSQRIYVGGYAEGLYVVRLQDEKQSWFQKIYIRH